MLDSCLNSDRDPDKDVTTACRCGTMAVTSDSHLYTLAVWDSLCQDEPLERREGVQEHHVDIKK